MFLRMFLFFANLRLNVLVKDVLIKKECTTFRPRRDYIFFYIRMVANLEGMNYNVVSLHHDVANEVIWKLEQLHLSSSTLILTSLNINSYILSIIREM